MDQNSVVLTTVSEGISEEKLIQAYTNSGYTVLSAKQGETSQVWFITVEISGIHKEQLLGLTM